MKSVFIVLFATLLNLSFIPLSAAEEAVHAATEANSEVYHCPMHPEVTGHKGDSCPKCGMKLVKAEAVVYHCPMHPEVTGHKGDSCPKCGMTLVPADNAAAEMPMHQH